MVTPHHINPISVTPCLTLALAIVALPNLGLADDQASPHVEVTTGAVSGMTTEQRDGAPDYRVLWPGHRLLTGTVDSISGGVIRVNTGELLPRFLSQREASEKGVLPLKRGDKLQVVLNEQNLVVDYHLLGQERWHRMVRGRLAQPLPVGQEWAVIRQEGNTEEAFSVRPLARSKVSAIPVNVPAIFLTDEANRIVDATFGSEEGLLRQTADWKRTPPKAPFRRVDGTLLRTADRVWIHTSDGKEQSFETRPYVREKLTALPGGSSVTLLLDDEDKVADLARPPV
jgi:hypothetical protein